MPWGGGVQIISEWVHPPPPGISWGKWYKNCLRPSELLDVNGRHLGFTFLIDRMTEVLTPDIYRAHWCKLSITSSCDKEKNDNFRPYIPLAVSS
jgi:hypothetical protein